MVQSHNSYNNLTEELDQIQKRFEDMNKERKDFQRKFQDNYSFPFFCWDSLIAQSHFGKYLYRFSKHGKYQISLDSALAFCCCCLGFTFPPPKYNSTHMHCVSSWLIYQFYLGIVSQQRLL